MGSASTSVESLLAEVSALRRKNAALEQKLEASETPQTEHDEWFRDLAENIQEVFWIHDLTKTLYISPAYEEIWGRSCQSLYENPQSFIDSIHPHDRDRITTRIESQGWEGFSDEYRIIRPDGDIRWIRDRAWPVRDESGKVIRVVGIAEDISFHKAVETSLRRYEQMVSTANVLMAFIDRDYRYQTVSKPYAETFEMAQENIIGKSLGEVVGSMDFERIKPYLDRCLQGESVSFEHWLDLPARGCCYLLVHYNPYYESDGSVSGIVADITDITERKRAEDNFKESEEKFRSMAETVPDIIFTNKPDGACDFVNQRLYEYTGLPSGSGLGFGWAKALHPDDFECSKDKWLRTMHLGLPYEDRYRIISPNGTYRWFMARALPIKKANGQIEKYFGVFTDIHDLVQTQEALRHSEERLDHALNAVGEGVWDWDLRTDKVFYSRQWCELLGFDPEEVESHMNFWKSRVHPDDLPKAMANLEAHLSGQTSVCRSEIQLRTKSGMWKWYLDVGKVVDRDQDGRPLRIVGIDVDITEQKQRQVLLEMMQQAQSQFILGNDPAEMFDHLLTNLLSITQSKYGFIGEVLFTTEGKPYLKTQAITNIAWNQETREMYERFAPNLEFFNLNSLFGKVITTGQPVVANDPMNDPRRGGLPKGHPPMHAFLGLPFYRGDRLVGMVGIANRPEGYDEQLITYLQPLLSTCGMLIEAHKISQQRIQAETTLRATEQMYRQILDSISDMVFVKDQNCRMVWANKAFRSYYHMTNEELEGILDAPFNEPAFTKEYNKDDAYVLNKKKILDIPEEPVTRYDGQVRLFHTIKAPLFGENGEVEKLVGVARDITERKQTELERAQRESLLRLIIETGPGCIKRVAADGTLLHMNPAGLKLIEAEGENEALGLSVFDLVVPEHLDAFRHMHQNVLQGEPQTLQFEVQGIKGTRHWMETYAVPFSNPITKEVEQLAVTHDITERKATEEVIRKGERKFRAIYEQAPTGIAVLDSVSGQFTQINQKYCDITGYSQEEMFDRTFQNITHPDDLQADLDQMQQLLAGQKDSFQMEKRYIRKDGQVVWVNLTCVPLWLEPTDARQHIAMVQDITHRKMAEKALKESEERYRTLYEDNPSMYFTVAQDGTILSVNQFGAHQLGYSVEELIGQPVIGVFSEDDKPLVQEHFKACLHGSERLYFWELRKQRKDGSVLWAREAARTIQGKDGKPVVLIVCEDITERKQTEERLRQSEAKETDALRQSDTLKSALLSSVSHELRTPLTAMKGSISSIIGNGSNNIDQEQQKFLIEVDREINYMSHLVDNLLDMSQIEAGSLIPHKEWHLLEDLVEGALRRTAQTLDTQNIEIYIPENVPPAFVDALEIQQVLINLLDNAVKYSLPFSPIRIQVHVDNQQITLEASNMGEPIPPQDLERIFDRFYRRPPPRQQPIRGTGLGLAICKGIVEAHGGRIWADSIGEEVKIAFTIPITKSMPSFSLEGRHKS